MAEAKDCDVTSPICASCTSQVNHSVEKCCRICEDERSCEKLVSPCFCSGSIGFVHVSCLERWLGLNGRTSCELCSYTFPVVKIYPTAWQYFKIPLDNIDVVCLLNVLYIITVMCSVSVVCFEHVGKTDTEFIILMLLVSLVNVVFVFLAAKFVFYHCRCFFIWRETNAQTRMSFDKTPPPMLRKCTETIHEHRADTSRAGQTQGGIPVFLRPGYSSAPTTSLAANDNRNANILNVTHIQPPASSEFQGVAARDETDDFISCSQDFVLLNACTTKNGTRSSNTKRRIARHGSCGTCKKESMSNKGLPILDHDDRTAFRVYTPNPNATHIQQPEVQRVTPLKDMHELFPKLFSLCEEIALSLKIANDAINKKADAKSKHRNNNLSSNKWSKTERGMTSHSSGATGKRRSLSSDCHSLVTQGLTLLGHDERTSAFKVYKPKRVKPNHQNQPANHTSKPNH